MNNTVIPLFILSFIITSLIIPDGYTQSAYTKTPSDMEGPFYPVEKRSDEDNNLIYVDGVSQSAQGDVLNLNGIVVSTDGSPLKGVTLEIWQTDANGLYRHPRDRSAGKRDPYFQYWGKAQTDDQGQYRFTTIIPGEYEPRPAHIHFKVLVENKVVLTSQMYIIKNTTNAPYIDERLRLKVTKNTKGEYSGFFRIVL